MSRTIQTNHGPMYLKTNRQPRPLYSTTDAIYLGADPRDFEYIEGKETRDWDKRIFQYRGSWYDANEFEVATDQIKALGFDGTQSESMFSAVLVTYWDRWGTYLDQSIIVGYIHC